MTFFEWDEVKAKSNRRKHGIDFEDAIEVFYDPRSLAEQDRVVDGEIRWQTIGMALGIIVLQVAHTINDQNEDEIIRLISARRASRKECKRYEQNCEKDLW